MLLNEEIIGDSELIQSDTYALRQITNLRRQKLGSYPSKYGGGSTFTPFFRNGTNPDLLEPILKKSQFDGATNTM